MLYGIPRPTERGKTVAGVWLSHIRPRLIDATTVKKIATTGQDGIGYESSVEMGRIGYGSRFEIASRISESGHSQRSRLNSMMRVVASTAGGYFQAGLSILSAFLP